MRGKEAKRVRPAESGMAWAAAFLMTVFLSLCLLSALAVQGLTSAGLHAGTAANDAILDGQMRSIHQYIDLLSEEYGFSSEGVKETIRREDLKQFNLEAASWWTRVLTEGESDSVPRWYSSKTDAAVAAAMAETERKEDPRTIAAAVSDKIDRTVFPLRETLLTTGLEFVNGKADIPGIVRSVRKLPTLLLALTVLTAGIIALMCGRDGRKSLKYFGTALAATGLVLVLCGGMLLFMGLTNMVGEASAGLAEEFRMVMRTLLLEGGGAALVTLAGGYGCLYLYRNGRKKRTKEATERAE